MFQYLAVVITFSRQHRTDTEIDTKLANLNVVAFSAAKRTLNGMLFGPPQCGFTQAAVLPVVPVGILEVNCILGWCTLGHPQNPRAQAKSIVLL